MTPMLTRRLPALFQVPGFQGQTRQARLLITTASLFSKDNEDPLKHTVLEQPTRFNPPSHGRRLPRKNLSKHYGPAFTADEIKEQKQRDYPGMLPPEGTFAHWFWTSKKVHGFIAIGTLTTLAIITFAMNFTRTSPYADLIPPIDTLVTSPLTFFSAWSHILTLHYEHLSRESQASRFQRIDDAMKRKMYQRAHGIDASPIVKFINGGEDFPESPELAREMEKARIMHAEREKRDVKDALEAYGDAIEKPPMVLEEERREREREILKAEAEAEAGKRKRKKWLWLF